MRVTIDDAILTGIADSLRNKTGTMDQYYPQDMASVIDGISGGGGDFRIGTLPYQDDTVLTVDIDVGTEEWNCFAIFANEFESLANKMVGIIAKKDIKKQLTLFGNSNGSVSASNQALPYPYSSNAMTLITQITGSVVRLANGASGKRFTVEKGYTWIAW